METERKAYEQPRMIIVLKCGTKSCANEHAYRVYWPGQTIDLCETCKDKEVAIASFMGFVVDYEAAK